MNSFSCFSLTLIMIDLGALPTPWSSNLYQLLTEFFIQLIMTLIRVEGSKDGNGRGLQVSGSRYSEVARS